MKKYGSYIFAATAALCCWCLPFCRRHGALRLGFIIHYNLLTDVLCSSVVRPPAKLLRPFNNYDVHYFHYGTSCAFPDGAILRESAIRTPFINYGVHYRSEGGALASRERVLYPLKSRARVRSVRGPGSGSADQVHGMAWPSCPSSGRSKTKK